LLSFHSGNASSKVSKQKTSQLLSQATEDGRPLKDCQVVRAISGILQTAPHQELIARGQGGVEQNCTGRPNFACAASTTLLLQTGVPSGKRCFQGSGDAFKCSGIKILGSHKHPDKNRTSAKAPANGWKRAFHYLFFSRENRQKCQVQQSL